MENSGKDKLKIPEKLPARQKKQLVEYKTETELKEEAFRRMEEQRLIEAARPPKSEKVKKYDNFMYHYKNHLLVGIVLVALVVFFARDVFFSIKPDLTITVVSVRHISLEAREELSSYLSAYVPDINGDGRNVLTVDYIQMPQSMVRGRMAGNTDPETDYANIMKLTAVIAANADPIFMLDELTYDYMWRTNVNRDENGQALSDDIDGLFAQMPGYDDINKYAIPVELTSISQDSQTMQQFAGMSFYIRDWENHKKNADIYANAVDLMKSISQ